METAQDTQQPSQEDNIASIYRRIDRLERKAMDLEIDQIILSMIVGASIIIFITGLVIVNKGEAISATTI